MAIRYNPDTGEYDIDPSSLAMGDAEEYFDPVLGDIDPLNDHKGVGGGSGDNSYSSVGVDPSTLWDPTKGVNWDSLKKFITSPQGIAGLGGAALGFLDKAPPSGGGTTMAYPGAAQLTRKMVQGPYGPVAEYTGVGGGAPDYTRFTAPKVEFPTVSQPPAAQPSSGMSVQAKVDLYKQLRGYGLSDERIRRIAETMFGTQTDSDWAELTKRAGTATGGIAGNAPTPTPAPAPKGTLPYDPEMAIPVPSPTPAPTPKVLYEDPSNFTGPPSLQVSQGSTAAQKAEEYRRLRRFGLSDSQIRGMADAKLGKQTDVDWQALVDLANPTATSTGQQTVGTTSSAEDPFIKSLREAMGESSTPSAYKDPISGSTLAVKRDAVGQPYELTFTNKQGQSKTITPSSGTSTNFLENANTLAKEYGVDLSKVFGSGSTAQGGNITKQDPGMSYLDPSLYATYGPMMAPGTPQQLVYSQEDEGLVYQPSVRGQNLGGVDFSGKTFDEVKNTLERFKQAPPKTQEELALANSAWSEYQNRFSSGSTKQFGNVTKNVDQFGNETGSYNSNLKPAGLLAQKYSQFGPLNELLSGLSSQAAEESSGISTTPFSHTANKLNTTLATLQANPLVQQTINRIAEVDPKVKFTVEDVVRLSGDIQESGAESAVRNFIRDKQNTQAVTSAKPGGVAGQNQTMSNQTYASYQDLLNQITPKANQSDWESMASRTSPGGNREVSTLWRDPTSGKGVGVATNNSGIPSELVFYDASGQSLNSSVFTPEGLYREAEKYGIDMSNIGQLGSMLEQKNIGYKPGQLYAGTGSNAGIDFEDIAKGGLGGKDDWTKTDPLMGLKFESGSLGEKTAIQQQNERLALAERLGIGSIVPTPVTQTAAPAAQALTTLGANPYGTAVLPAAAPAPVQPRNLMSLLPQDWGSITDPQKKIDFFNQQKATEAELASAGVGQGDIDWMRQHGFGKYAHGGSVQMEDGGFVMTKRAVDGAGGPQGIAQLVPGARMIRGPGNGTSDDVPAVINGRNGQTPARLSNGEAYVPKRFVQDQGGPQRMYALMNQLQRKA